MLKPIERRSLSDEVFEQLKNQILSGGFHPGSRLPPERKLADALRVNRGALREALKRLEQARLVSIQHGGATRVADFMKTGGLDLLTALLWRDGQLKTKVARSIVEMRSVLAPDIARLAAGRASGEAKEHLLSVAEQMAQTSDVQERQLLAVEFWSWAVEASDNVAYRLCYNTLQKTYARFFDLLTPVLKEELDHVDGYRAIAEAVAAGDSKKAETEARALIQKGAEPMLALFEDGASKP